MNFNHYSQLDNIQIQFSMQDHESNFSQVTQLQMNKAGNTQQAQNVLLGLSFSDQDKIKAFYLQHLKPQRPNKFKKLLTDFQKLNKNERDNVIDQITACYNILRSRPINQQISFGGGIYLTFLEALQKTEKQILKKQEAINSHQQPSKCLKICQCCKCLILHPAIKEFGGAFASVFLLICQSLIEGSWPTLRFISVLIGVVVFVQSLIRIIFLINDWINQKKKKQDGPKKQQEKKIITQQKKPKKEMMVQVQNLT